jgi:osmotically inducible lipoprotein OsmB
MQRVYLYADGPTSAGIALIKVIATGARTNPVSLVLGARRVESSRLRTWGIEMNIAQTFSKRTLALLVAIGMMGCSGMSQRGVDTAAGAGVGAVGGAVLTGGSAIGTVGGAVVGGVVGNQIGK